MKLLSALLFLSSAANASVTWGPQTRAGSISVDSEAIIVTLPATTTDATIGVDGADGGVIVTLPTTPATDGSIGVDGADVELDGTEGGMSVNEVASYYGNQVVDYYGEGVTVTVDKIEANAAGSVSSSSSVGSSVSSSSVVSVSGSSGAVVKGGVTKKSKGEAFWSAHASKGSVTGLCLYNKGSSSYKHASKGSASYYYADNGYSSYSAYESAPFKGSSKKSRSAGDSCSCKEKRRELQWGNDGHSSGGSAVKVSSGSANKVSGDTSNKVSSGSSNKVTSGSSKVTTVKVSGSSSKVSGGAWAGDAHGAAKVTSSSSKVTANKDSSSKVKVSGSSSKASSGMWAGDAHGVTKNSSKDSSSKVKVSGSSGGMWAGDAHGSSKMTSEKTSKITSVKGSAVSFKGSDKTTDLKSSVKTAVTASWEGDSWGKVSIKKESSVSIKGSSSYEYSCSCETSFEVDVCVTTPPSSEETPTPSPINPLVPVTTNPPSSAGTIEVNEIDCKDDYAMTSTGVSIEIPVLDNDGIVPNGSTGSITQPNHGLTIITDSSILYVPDSDCCGVDTFTYTIANGETYCTATVTVSVVCSGDGTTPPPSVTPTDQVILHGTDALTAPPSSIPVDPVNPDGGDLNIQKPVANDDFYTTNQDESIEIAILKNDTLIVGTTGTYTKPPNGELSTVEDDFLYTPNNGFCGIDQFSYTLTDATKEYSDSAVVTILVLCAPVPTPTPETSEPTYFTGDDSVAVPLNHNQTVPNFDRTDSTSAPSPSSGDDLVGVPPEFSEDTVAPSPEPTLFTGDDEVGVPHEFNQTQPGIERPELEDDYAITNQSVPVFIPILDNDIIPHDSTGMMGNPMHGDIDATSDGIIYSPFHHFCGFEKFEYSVTDSSGMFTDIAEVTVEVTCVENPTPSPTLASGDDLVGVPPEFNENTTAPSPEPTQIQPTIGEFNLNDDYAITNQGEDVIISILENDTIPNDSTGSFTKPQNGEITILDGDDVLYTPSKDFCGTDTFTYTITDLSQISDTATVTVDVVCETVTTSSTEMVFTTSTVGISEKLEANDDFVTTTEGVPVNIPVIDNDYLPVNATGKFYQPLHGEVDVGIDGVVYTPDADFCGVDTFTYTIIDAAATHSDSATVTVEVTCIDTPSTSVPGNHSPVANDDEATTLENQPVYINVASNDNDDEDDALTVTSVAECKEGGSLVIVGDGSGGVVEYTPAPGFHGNDHCDYTICDEGGQCDSACIIITVEKPSALPLAVNDAATTDLDTAIEIEVTGNDISPNGYSLTVTSIGESEKGALVAIVGDGSAGFVLYEPPSGFIGKDEFSYTITDGEGETSTAIVYITVNSIDTVDGSVTTVLPTSSATDATLSPSGHSCSTTENAAVIYIIDSDTSSFITSITNGTNGICELTGNTTIMYTPNTDFSGQDECEYELCDDASVCGSGTLTITVTPGDNSSQTETMSTGASETTTSTVSETSSTILAESTTTEAPDGIIPHGSDGSDMHPTASYICPEVDTSNVTKNTLLYKYQVMLDAEADVDAVIQVIELELNDVLASHMSCSSTSSGRNLIVSGLVGANSNPPDTVSDEECESDESGQCVVINGGITVYGDVDLQAVRNYVGSEMPRIVSSTEAIESRLMTSSATLDSTDATNGEDGSSTLATMAIAGSAVVALVGAALFLSKRRSNGDLSEESQAVLRDEFSPKSAREIPRGSSEDSDTLLTSNSFDSKPKKSLKSVFGGSADNDESAPSSPAFSVKSSQSKSYDIEDTVDL